MSTATTNIRESRLTSTALSTSPADSKAAGRALKQSGKRKNGLVLFLASFVLSTAAFFALDWIYTATMPRPAAASLGEAKFCGVKDPVRHHAFQPNCASVGYWGGDSYKFFSNSLGFRDEKIREVPQTDARPRILMLGNSYVEGKLAWRNSLVGRIANHFPQYDILNGGEDGYSPSNFLNTARMVQAKGIDIDEVIVFLDPSAVHAEAGFYRDADPSGAVIGIDRDREHSAESWYVSFRSLVIRHFALTSAMLSPWERLQMLLVRHGYYHLPATAFGDPFDTEMSAWTYRQVNESDLFPAGYAPLGVAGGLAKQEAKMTLLWQELARHNIPISVVVYPQPAQLVHDTAESKQVQLLRQWCEGKCKRFVSVFPAFLAVKARCPWSDVGCWYPKLFVIRDVHYTAAGNALVADAVIQSLTQEPAVKHSAGSGSQTFAAKPQARPSM